MESRDRRMLLRIPVLYTIFAGLWILFSDRILGFFVRDSARLTNLQIFKGWFFVSITAILLFVLLRQELKARRVTEQERDDLLVREQAARTYAEQEQQRYRLLFESNPLPMWVFDLETLAFLAVNDAASRHYGYTSQEFLSMTLRDIRPARDVPGLMDVVNAQPDRYAYIQGLKHLKKDGTRIDVEISANDILFNNRRARLVLVNDVTERIKFESDLAQANQALEAIVQSSPLAIAIIDENDALQVWNPAAERTFGWSAAEVIGKPAPYVQPGKLEEFAAALKRVRAGETITNFETERIRRDGSIVPISVSTAPLRGKDGAIKNVMAVLTDITDRKRSEERIRRQLDRMAALRNIDLAISTSLDLRISLTVLLDHVITQMGVDAAAVMLYQPQSRRLECVNRRGFRRQAPSLALQIGEGLSGRVALDRQIIQIRDLEPHIASQSQTSGIYAPLLDEGFVAYVGAPLIAKGQMRGVLEIFNRSPRDHDEDWLEFLETLAGQAAIAIDNSVLFDDLQLSNAELIAAYDATIEGWSHAVDLRDRETEKHTRRMLSLTLRLAQTMNVPASEMVHIRRGVLLHDIGKLGVPDEILHKPGPLTEEQWIQMRRHPVYAYEMLWPIVYLRPALDIPYCHHEKWDGSGYPRGLSAEQIPLAARIFSLVDVLDALTCDRPYRKAWTVDDTRQYIRKEVGTQFDPVVFKMLEKIWQQDDP